MPQQVLPTEAGFLWLKYELELRGFHTLTEVQRAEFRKLNLVSPRPCEGREEGFVFNANGLMVWVWTTWLAKERMARDVDAGWVVITKENVPLYFSRPMHRTKNFLLSLFRRAWIARFRVVRRPHCPACNALMEIVRGSGLKERYWRCDLTHAHKGGGSRSRRWDVGLPPKAQQYVDALRKKQKAAEVKAIAAGRNPHAAMLNRKVRRAKKA